MPLLPPHRHGITPGHQGARFAGFDVLDQAHQWDRVTAGVVLSRLRPPAELSFFTPGEAAVARPLLDRLLAQDSEPRVPVLELIDARLAAGEHDGWHYDDMPPDAAAWRATVAALDEDAQQFYRTGFGDLTAVRQTRLIQHVQDLDAAGRSWHQWPAGHVWNLWFRYSCAAFYSHPWAWNEIGFSGPAYPRGYLNLGINARESFEVADGKALDPAPVAAHAKHAAHPQHDRHESSADA